MIDRLIQIIISIALLIQASTVVVVFVKWASEKGILRSISSLILNVLALVIYSVAMIGWAWLGWKGFTVASVLTLFTLTVAASFATGPSEMRRFEVAMFVFQLCLAFAMIVLAALGVASPTQH